MQPVPLAVSIRGNAVESIHYGSVAVVDAQNRLLYCAGDPDFLTFTRSTLKPFQAAPFVAEDGPAQAGFTEREIALMCASHSGEPMHVAGVRGMLEKIGCTESDLQCGCHPPLHDEPAPGNGPRAVITQLHNNCSGKHAGFLAWCVRHGIAHAHYLDLDHPLQQAIRHSVTHFTGVAGQALKRGIDGCSAPNYAMPLRRLAWAYARLAQGRADATFGDTLDVLFHAMTAHPEFVAGTGRFDLAVMRSAPGDWVAKGGAEAVQVIGVRTLGLGIAIKIVDGNSRAIPCVTTEVLRQLGLLPAPAASALADWAAPTLRNLRDQVVGRLEPRVRLAEAERP